MATAEGAERMDCSLSTREFLRLKNFIHGHCGIKITDSKKSMLEARLRKRLRSLALDSLSEYCDYLFSQKGMKEELTHMIDQVTTNKTDFFREPGHFDYLAKIALPQIALAKKTVRLWSAACSTGEEAYTLAMVVNEFSDDAREIDYRILATDISTRVLEKATTAIYDEQAVEPVPPQLKRKYLLRSKDESKRLYRVTPGLRQRVAFRRLNLMDGDFGLRREMDIIFCRNVIIYFDRRTQEKLLNSICRCLSPGGYLFMGHSETLFGMNLPLTQAVPTVYQRVG